MNQSVFAEENRHPGLPQRLDEREEALADTLWGLAEMLKGDDLSRIV